MTDEQALALGQRWVALDLPWMAGMLTLCGQRALEANEDGIYTHHYRGMGWKPCEQIAPDFRDPATLGCLLFQADPAVCDTEADALIAVLEVVHG